MGTKPLSRRSAARVISATAAAKNFGALIDRVRSERAEYVVERGGAPVARIGPAVTKRCSLGDLVALLRSHSRPAEAYLNAVEAGIKSQNRPAVPVNRWES